MAINEAKNTYDALLDTNRMFQGKIKELRYLFIIYIP